ncbi:antibiotic biosynthesis monooxygenase-like domain containing protein [Synechococcus sp. SYN20]|nr:TIGR03792 family protein [Synechococcus sp. SYN20]QNJ25293.1 antibiotic biosynthesis monooxygenase-like domain containing protein [Synechococcus sp. SYN20]
MQSLYQRCQPLMIRVSTLLCVVLVLMGQSADVRFAAFADPEGGYDVAVIEHLRLSVPEQGREAWLEAERGSWEPWLAQQMGFLGRDLLWDPETEEGTLLIRWSSRQAWKAIPSAEVEEVQTRFEQLARDAMSLPQAMDNPFPLVFEGELLPP